MKFHTCILMSCLHGPRHYYLQIRSGNAIGYGKSYKQDILIPPAGLYEF